MQLLLDLEVFCVSSKSFCVSVYLWVFKEKNCFDNEIVASVSIFYIDVRTLEKRNQWPNKCSRIVVSFFFFRCQESKSSLRESRQDRAKNIPKDRVKRNICNRDFLSSSNTKSREFVASRSHSAGVKKINQFVRDLNSPSRNFRVWESHGKYKDRRNTDENIEMKLAGDSMYLSQQNERARDQLRRERTRRLRTTCWRFTRATLTFRML